MSEVQFRCLRADDSEFEEKRKQWIAEIEQEKSEFLHRFNPHKMDYETIGDYFDGPDEFGKWHPSPADTFHGFSKAVYKFSEGFGHMHRMADMFNRIRLQTRFGSEVMRIVGWQEIHRASEDVFRRLVCLVVLGYSPDVVHFFAENHLDPADFGWTEPIEE
jgi:hypothetical protein